MQDEKTVSSPMRSMSTRCAELKSSGVLLKRKLKCWRSPAPMEPLAGCTSPRMLTGERFCSQSSHRPPLDTADLTENIRLRLDSLLTAPAIQLLTNQKRLKELCQFYDSLCLSQKTVFLQTLSTDYAVNQASVLDLAKSLPHAQECGTSHLLRHEDRLRRALVPRYQHLFTQISHIESGVKFLVDFRSDLLTLLASRSTESDDAPLQAMKSCLRDLFSLWFGVGFLQLSRITWQSSCDMLQKISDYEAVHPIRNWTDLKRRVGSYRRCFVFTHRSMPLEPVIVLHTALTNEISDSIQSIVQNRLSEHGGGSEAGDQEDSDYISTAVFYSITSTQKGLQGIEMGNYLIKSVVRELLTEFPKMQHFSSLSPIPGFRDWLLGEINKHLLRHDVCEERDDEDLLLASEVRALSDALHPPAGEPLLARLKAALLKGEWASDAPLSAALAPPLLRLCARYLYIEKRRAYAYNPVAHFHLRNGAVLWRLNWLADTTSRGYSSSCGIMVNYRYFLDETECNSKQYIERHHIKVSPDFLQLLPDMNLDCDIKPDL